MLETLSPSSANNCPYDEGNRYLSPRTVPQNGNHVRQLIEGQKQEINSDVVVNGLQTINGCPQPDSRHCVFGERRVKNPFRPEPLFQSPCRAKDGIVIWHTQTANKNPAIPFHFLQERLPQSVLITYETFISFHRKCLYTNLTSAGTEPFRRAQRSVPLSFLSL